MADVPAVPVRQPDTHSCPGKCGCQVPVHHFACLSCWMRLPYALRQPINTHYRRDQAAHAEAMAAASRWYATHRGITT